MHNAIVAAIPAELRSSQPVIGSTLCVTLCCRSSTSAS
jgi:hypothetical protein